MYSKNPVKSPVSNNSLDIALKKQSPVPINNFKNNTDNIINTSQNSSKNSNSGEGGDTGGSNAGGSDSENSFSTSQDSINNLKELPLDLNSSSCGFYYSEYSTCRGVCPEGECVSEGRSCYCKKIN